MPEKTRRRDFMTAAAGGAAALALPLGVAARAFAANVRVTRLADSVRVLSGPTGNVTAIAGSDAVALVDGGHAGWAADLLAAVADEFDGRAVDVLFNTHWHPEQTGANGIVGERGAARIAHENTRLWLSTTIRHRWQDHTYEPLPEAALPNRTFYDATEIAHGAGAIEAGYLPQAHTDGDIYVHVPAANVLATGGVVASDAWPLVDWWTGGWIGGLLDGLERLLAIADDATRIVPVSGPPMTRAELAAQYDMFSTIFDRLHECLIKSYSVDETLATRPTRGFKPEWGDPELFVDLAFRSFRGHLRESRRITLMP